MAKGNPNFKKKVVEPKEQVQEPEVKDVVIPESTQEEEKEPEVNEQSVADAFFNLIDVIKKMEKKQRKEGKHGNVYFHLRLYIENIAYKRFKRNLHITSK